MGNVKHKTYYSLWSDNFCKPDQKSDCVCKFDQKSDYVCKLYQKSDYLYKLDQKSDYLYKLIRNQIMFMSLIRNQIMFISLVRNGQLGFLYPLLPLDSNNNKKNYLNARDQIFNSIMKSCQMYDEKTHS